MEFDSANDDGVIGKSTANGKSGVFGFNALSGSNGVAGISHDGNGVYGKSNSFNGIYGQSATGSGVHGFSPASNGVFGDSNTGAGISGHSKTQHGVYGASDQGTGVYGHGGAYAGYFDGKVGINGELLLNGSMTVQSGGDIVFADLAEHFLPVPGKAVRPGAVVVLAESGLIEPCADEYDTRVVGVVSGAGHYRPALVLDRRPDEAPCPAVSLMGKVFCLADATVRPIRAGDLLTSSATPGHAMVADDRARRGGAIIGKALQSLAGGHGLIPILVTLQ
jgi:hypothetical protein